MIHFFLSELLCDGKLENVSEAPPHDLRSGLSPFILLGTRAGLELGLGVQRWAKSAL